MTDAERLARTLSSIGKLATGAEAPEGFVEHMSTLPVEYLHYLEATVVEGLL